MKYETILYLWSDSIKQIYKEIKIATNQSLNQSPGVSTSGLSFFIPRDDHTNISRSEVPNLKMCLQ
jgi:hypothetical protein